MNKELVQAGINQLQEQELQALVAEGFPQPVVERVRAAMSNLTAGLLRLFVEELGKEFPSTNRVILVEKATEARPQCIAVSKRTGTRCGQPLFHFSTMHSNGNLTMGGWADDECTEESLAELMKLRAEKQKKDALALGGSK